jgi:DnaK suppressor protein
MSGQPDVRGVLAVERASTLERLAALEREFAGIAGSSPSADDEHDPEGATIAFEREHVAALAGQARQHLAEIDAALGRLADGSYGTCETCGQPIGEERLAARPVTATCIRCASRR